MIKDFFPAVKQKAENIQNKSEKYTEICKNPRLSAGRDAGIALI